MRCLSCASMSLLLIPSKSLNDGQLFLRHVKHVPRGDWWFSLSHFTMGRLSFFLSSIRSSLVVVCLTFVLVFLFVLLGVGARVILSLLFGVLFGVSKLEFGVII